MASNWGSAYFDLLPPCRSNVLRIESTIVYQQYAYTTPIFYTIDFRRLKFALVLYIVGYLDWTVNCYEYEKDLPQVIKLLKGSGLLNTRWKLYLRCSLIISLW